MEENYIRGENQEAGGHWAPSQRLVTTDNTRVKTWSDTQNHEMWHRLRALFWSYILCYCGSWLNSLYKTPAFLHLVLCLKQQRQTEIHKDILGKLTPVRINWRKWRQTRILFLSFITSIFNYVGHCRIGGHLHHRTAPKPGPGFRGEGCGSSKRCMTGCHTTMVSWYLSDNLYKRPCLLPSLRAKQSLGLHFCLLNGVHIITETNSSPEIPSEGNSQNIVPINFC